MTTPEDSKNAAEQDALAAIKNAFARVHDLMLSPRDERGRRVAPSVAEEDEQSALMLAITEHVALGVERTAKAAEEAAFYLGELYRRELERG